MAGYQEESRNLKECPGGRSWSPRMSCKVGAGTAEESSAEWQLQSESLQTLVEIPLETERERLTLHSHFQSPVPPICRAPKEPI